MGDMVDPHSIFSWIEQKEPELGRDEALMALKIAYDQTTLDADTLLQSSQHLKKAFSELLERHAGH